MMEHKDTIKKVLGAVFFIAGLILICAVIFIIGRDKGFAQQKFRVTVIYKDIGGLIDGAPVRLAGVNVGNVAHIDFLDKQVDGRRVGVILNIFEKYRPQLENKHAAFVIETEGILGQKLVEIYVTEEGEPVDLTKPVPGEESVNVEDLAEVFAQAAESFTETSDKLSGINIDQLSGALENTAASISKTSDGLRVMLREVEYLTLKMRRVLNRVEQKLIDGDLFKVF